MFHSKSGFSNRAAAAAVVLAAGYVQGATILPVTSADVPASDPASVFDCSNTGNVYGLGAGTSFIPEGFDIRDLFGGDFGTYAYEHQDVVFDNYHSQGTVEEVDVTLAAPVSLTNYNLFLADDGPDGNRSASEFRLFAGGQLIDDVPILDASGTESYTSVYGSDVVDVSDTFTELPSASDYTLQFIQNQGAGPGSGIRALEFDATGDVDLASSGDGPTVPEPSSFVGVLLSGVALCARRRRT